MASITFEGVILNVDAADAASGTGVAKLIVDVANNRPHLKGHIVSAQWDRERGIGILVDDAGHRNHLANALGFDKGLEQFTVRGIGTGYARKGFMLGFDVTIWNLEP